VGNNVPISGTAINNALCGTVPASPGPGARVEINCNNGPLQGTFLSVQLRGDRKVLTLCEVEAYTGEQLCRLGSVLRQRRSGITTSAQL
jgi:hypothetical protein